MSSSEAEAYRLESQAAQALDRRQYETNSRIRFNHRGQVAMALGVDDKDDVEDLQPQFFITLEDAPYLDSKHVIFGTVSGPTIFNAVRIGRMETDEETHQPVDLQNSTRIKSVKIAENPLHQGLAPHPNPPWRVKPKTNDTVKPKKKKKRKGKFDTNVLSFGDEFEEEGDVPSKAKKGMQSSHDIIDSKVLSKQVDEQVKGAAKTYDKEVDDGETKLPAKKARVEAPSAESTTKVESAATKRQEAKASGESTFTEKRSERQEPTREKAKPSKEPRIKSAPKRSLVESRRLKYSKGKKSKKEREEETLNKLMAFRSTVQKKVEERKSSLSGQHDGSEVSRKDDSLASRMARRAEKANGSGNAIEEPQAPAYHGQILDSDEEEDAKGGNENKWLGTAFKCTRHMDHDTRGLGGDGRAVDDYEVIDSKRGGRRSRHRREDKGRKHHRN